MELGKQQKLRLACELSADRVIAARAENGLIALSAVRTLGAGAIVPSLAAANIVRHDVVRTAVQEALAAVVSGRGRDVIAVVPDAACRVVLVDFDSLPADPSEAEAVVRFRLKKSLPFDVDRSRVSFHAQPLSDGRVSVVAAVLLKSVLEEYETVLREAGYNAGVVVPSTLAALGQVDASVPTLVIKVDPGTTSVTIVDNQKLVLLRTLDNPAGANPETTNLAEDVYPSLVFYQDTYGRNVERILVGGRASGDQLNMSLAEVSGIRAQELVSASRVGTAAGPDRAALAGVVGALAS